MDTRQSNKYTNTSTDTQTGQPDTHTLQCTGQTDRRHRDRDTQTLNLSQTGTHTLTCGERWEGHPQGQDGRTGKPVEMRRWRWGQVPEPQPNQAQGLPSTPGSPATDTLWTLSSTPQQGDWGVEGSFVSLTPPSTTPSWNSNRVCRPNSPAVKCRLEHGNRCQVTGPDTERGQQGGRGSVK